MYMVRPEAVSEWIHKTQQEEERWRGANGTFFGAIAGSCADTFGYVKRIFPNEEVTLIDRYACDKRSY